MYTCARRRNSTVRIAQTEIRFLSLTGEQLVEKERGANSRGDLGSVGSVVYLMLSVADEVDAKRV